MPKAAIHQLSIAITVLLLTAVWLWGDSALRYSPFETLTEHRGIITTTGLLLALLLALLLTIYLNFSPSPPPHAPQATQPSQRPSLLTGIAFFCVLLISTAFIHMEHRREAAEKRADAMAIAASYADSLSSLIEQSKSTTTALAYLIRAEYGQISNFDTIAADLLATTPGITNLQLAPDGVVMQVVPLKGNEKAIGHNLLADPKRTKEAFDAVKTGQLTLAGPFTLRQGGVAVIARQPVFIDSPPGKRNFWGFASALMLLEPLLQQAKIENLEAQHYAWTLHRVHPDTGRIDIFAASSAPLYDNTVSHRIKIPNGEWVLSLSPIGGWVGLDSLAIDSILVLAITVLLTMLAYNISLHPQLLAEELVHRTQDLNQEKERLKQAQQNLIESEERLELALSGAELGLWDVNFNSGQINHNARWAEMLGYHPQDLQASMDQWKQLTHPDDLAIALHKLNEHKNGKTDIYQADIRMRTRSGEWKWIQTTGKVFERDADGNAVRALGTHQDISQRKALELELETLSSAITHSPVATIVTTTEPKILYVNPQFTKNTGYSPAEVVGKNPRILQSGDTPLETYQALWDTINAKRVWSGELCNKNKNGELMLENISIAPVLNEFNEITNYIAVEQDITEKRQMEETIWQQANFDALTGLANRAHFAERCNQAITRAERNNQRVLILYLDLDNFKPVNDTYGHSAGDTVLKAFAERLQSAIRSSDTAARVGGDEFTVVIEDLGEEQAVEQIIDTLHDTLVSQPYLFQQRGNGAEVAAQVGASIGFALYPDHGTELEKLLSHADSVMYLNKETSALKSSDSKKVTN
ncbi:MAG: diguanylate cyclase [Halopseudomonas sp.]